MTQKELIVILEACGFQKHDNLLIEYSGRWMFGRHCVAVFIEHQHPTKAVIEVARVAFSALDTGKLTVDQCGEFIKALQNSRYDDIGTQGLIYFPEIRK